MIKTVRPIAIYLPQFHPIPENDVAWGKGFTEWTNVKKAKPLFSGHYQPHVPHKNVGYYDLRDANVLVEQAAMAKEHGIFGFAFYHYWFNGKRMLETPLDNMLKNGKPDFPFCYIWANENWTRRWDGNEKEIIIKQQHSFEDDKNHIHFLFDVFEDSRYIKINGKPLFIIYKPELFPDIKKTVEIWRHEATKTNFKELYICYFENGIHDSNPQLLGFDAAIEFQPRWKTLPISLKGSFYKQLLNKLKIKTNPFLTNRVFSYADVAENMIKTNASVNYKRFPCITPMWDNTARRKKGATVFINSTPKIYSKWLKALINKFEPYSKDENFIFINAWNEWAEGNHLEPCQKWNFKYLEATKKTLNNLK